LSSTVLQISLHGAIPPITSNFKPTFKLPVFADTGKLIMQQQYSSNRAVSPQQHHRFPDQVLFSRFTLILSFLHLGVGLGNLGAPVLLVSLDPRKFELDMIVGNLERVLPDLGVTQA